MNSYLQAAELRRGIGYQGIRSGGGGRERSPEEGAREARAAQADASGVEGCGQATAEFSGEDG